MTIILGMVSCSKQPGATPVVNNTTQTPAMNSVELSLVGNWITDSMAINNTTYYTTINTYNNPSQDHLYLYNTVFSNPGFVGNWYGCNGEFTLGNLTASIPWKASGDTLSIAGTDYIVTNMISHNLVLTVNNNLRYYLHK